MTLERFFLVIKATLRKLMGKLDDPAVTYEHSHDKKYRDLQEQIIQFRQEVAEAVTTERKLKQTLLKNKHNASADLEVHIKQQKKLRGKLRRRFAKLENELMWVQAEGIPFIPTKKALKAMRKSNLIFAGIFSELVEIGRDVQELSKDDSLSEAKRMAGLVSHLCFALVLLVLTITFLVYVFICVEQPFIKLAVIPATFLFMVWIWWRENRWFMHSAGMLWQEMSKDLQNLISGRRD